MHHLQLHDPHRARTFFEAATVAHPLSPQGYYGQALAHRESRYFSARLQEQNLLNALERDQHHEEARILLLEFYAQVGLFDQARARYEELPADWRSPLIEEALVPEASARAQGSRWYRLTRRQKTFLACLDLVFVGLCVASTLVVHLLPICLYLLALLIPQHILWFWGLETDSDGFKLRSCFRSRKFCWGDLLDLVELPDGGFFLQLRDRAFFVSRHWHRYGDLLLNVKHHLYECGWMPAFNKYARSRWARPLVA
jgi:hypothetical protein